MQRKTKRPVAFILLFSFFILLLILLMQPLEIYLLGNDIAMLFPAGKIAFLQRNLHLIIQGLMLLVVIPVYILTFYFSWKYRADNPKANYQPNLDDHPIAEVIWWGLPFILILVLSYMTWVKTHELDPYRPLVSDKKPIQIQVVALQWKWLFIYPEEGIATVNFIQFPKDTPLNFEITADAPMNSFWIPKLGGQIYAMPSMRTKLHLIANEEGEFRGASANISGTGFAGMTFIAKSTTEEEYKKWLQETKQKARPLNFESYTELAKPSENQPVSFYTLESKDLFEQILMKFMTPHKKEKE